MFKIMIVEDNKVLQDEIERILIHNGYEICKPTTFEVIPKLVQENVIDLILLDINLP